MNEKIQNIKLYQSQRDNYIPSLRIGTRKANSSFALARLSRAINKRFYNLGLGSALNRYDNSLTLYSAAADKKLYRGYESAEVFCNFGSGAFFHKRWKNYDYPGQTEYYKALQGKEGADFTGIDLCVRDLVLPHAEGEVALIYCSHTLEHLEENAAIRFLAECKRILKSGGVLRLALPDTTRDFKIVGMLGAQESISDGAKKAVCVQAADHVLAGTSGVLDSAEIQRLMMDSDYSASDFYSAAVGCGVSGAFDPGHPERHISFWGYRKLLEVSGALGFTCCIPCYKGSSLALPFSNLHVFDTGEDQLAFYVELVK